MIEIIYDGNTTLQVRGHAGSAEPGKDLICAAVTALTLTLGESAEKAQIQRGQALLQGGSSQIFEAIARGFALLGAAYPYAVHYKCMDIEKEK